jgi:hypothetical protein
MRRKKIDATLPTETTEVSPSSSEEPSPSQAVRSPRNSPAKKSAKNETPQPAAVEPATRSRAKKAPSSIAQLSAPESDPVSPGKAVVFAPETPATRPAAVKKPRSKLPAPAAKAEVMVTTLPEILDVEAPESAPLVVSKGSKAKVQTVKSKPKSKPKPAAKAPEEPVPSPIVATAETKAGTAKAKPKTSSTRGRSATPEITVSEIAEPVRAVFEFSSTDEFGDDLPVPTFRPRQKPSKPAQAPRGGSRPKQAIESAAVPESPEGAPISASEAANAEFRKKRRRRGRDRGPEAAGVPPQRQESDSNGVLPTGDQGEFADEAEDNESLLTPVFRSRKIEEPKVPERMSIEVPKDAPQVVVRNGVPTLVRDHRVYPPLVFFGSSPDERRATTVLDELGMAAEAGVHLHSHLIEFEVDPESVDAAVGFAAYMLTQSVQVDPESQVIFRVVFQAPRYWLERYPNAKYRTADGTVAEPSLCDDDFWGVARDCLSDFIKKLLLLELRGHILGVHLERGEWFFAEDWGYDTSKAAQGKFRDWTRTRYGNDEVTLRASWFDGSVKFDTVAIPEYQPEGSEGDKFVRSSRKQRRFVDYHLFLSDATVHRIADLAYAVKEASAGMSLVGVSYGYTFEWSHPSNGHLALGKLLRTPEIDFIAGPPSYRTREPGGAAPFPGPIDSFALNGKLYISEEDFKTSLSKGHEPDDFNPVIKTPQALESIHWRGAGAALAHGSGVAWMDLWGNGWLRTHSVWERAGFITKALVGRMNAGLGDPEVAVFIDERALAYLVDQNAFSLLVQNVREAILHAGVNAGFYLLSDLAHREKFPESKLYIFLNAWDVRPELRAAIKSRLQKDNKVLFWLYAAGLFDAGRDSLERAREVTGIALKPQPFHSKAGTTILNRRHPLAEAFPERTIISAKQLEPSYFAIPEDATVLGEYTQTGLPSFVVKEFKDGGDPSQQWTSVFLGEPLVNPALIRALAQMAGAHVFNFHQDTVHVRPPFCTVHCSTTGPRTITLPDKWSAYNLLSGQWATVDSSNLRFIAAEGSTHVFLVGPRVELEHILQTSPEDALRMDTIPVRELNLRQDHSTFDVPIMKLDQWMEGSDTDDVADEWFLRPPQLPEEAIETATESTEKIGRRRRRRRGGRGDRPERDESVPARTFSPSESQPFDDLGLNVMFRKRD